MRRDRLRSLQDAGLRLAGATGFEPATSSVTGRCAEPGYTTPPKGQLPQNKSIPAACEARQISYQEGSVLLSAGHRRADGPNWEAVGVRGDLILVRDDDGQPLVRRLWSSNRAAAYVCNVEQFELLSEGASSSAPVGFPWEDAFEFDEPLVAALWDAFKRGDRNRLKALWSKAQPFTSRESK